MVRNKGEHASPKEEQGGEGALVLGANEGAAEFNRRAWKMAKEAFVKLEERARVERIKAALFHEVIGQG